MTDQKTDLLPCPFCGGEAVPSCRDGGDERVHWACQVFCIQCRASTGEVWGVDGDVVGDYKAQPDAIAAWNTRADLADDRVTLAIEQAAAECEEREGRR